MKKLPRVYWDTSAFLAWLKPEPNRRAQCEEVLGAAESGKVQIVTSAISLIEVIKLDKGPLQLTPDKERKIKLFFQHDWIIVVQVTRHLAELARSLIWVQSLRPRDAIHAATAIAERIADLHTYDGDFLRLDGKVGSPPLAIRQPHMQQGNLPFPPPA